MPALLLELARHHLAVAAWARAAGRHRLAAIDLDQGELYLRARAVHTSSRPAKLAGSAVQRKG